MMTASRKDLAIFILAIIFAVVTYTKLLSSLVPLLTNVRTDIFLVAFLGIIIQAVGGILALVFAIMGIISGNPDMLTFLGSIILLLWVVTTLRHLIRI